MSRFLRAALGKSNQAKTTTSTAELKITKSTATPSSGVSVEHGDSNEQHVNGAAELPASENAISTDVSEKKDASTNVYERNASAAEEGDGKKPVVDDDENKYLSGWKLAPLTFGLCMATFVVALDNTVSMNKALVLQRTDQAVRLSPPLSRESQQSSTH